MNEIRLFDSHLHLSDQAFEQDRRAVLQRARDAGVAELVTVASDPADARRAIDVARASPGVWATAGLHPHEASTFNAERLAELEDLVALSEVVAIGETGLDYHYDNSPKQEQRDSFRSQLQLAEQVDLPVVVHSRDADTETASGIVTFKRFDV
ncbi:MAG: TatD family hydrolase [Gemmatimonadales bacterium]